MAVRLLTVLLAALSLVAVLATPQRRVAGAAEDANALLAKHRAYVGWQFGDGTLASWLVVIRTQRRKRCLASWRRTL